MNASSSASDESAAQQHHEASTAATPRAAQVDVADDGSGEVYSLDADAAERAAHGHVVVHRAVPAARESVTAARGETRSSSAPVHIAAPQAVETSAPPARERHETSGPVPVAGPEHAEAMSSRRVAGHTSEPVHVSAPESAEMFSPAAGAPAAAARPDAETTPQPVAEPAAPPAIEPEKTEVHGESRFSRLFDVFRRSHDDGGAETASTAVPIAPNEEEKLLLQLVNVERTSRGLLPVAWDASLARMARSHAVDMSSVHRMSHESSRDGADYSVRLQRTNYRAKCAAENVAFNADVIKAHRALMDSPGHRRNILDPALAAIGAGVAHDPKGDWVYVAEDFATPIAGLSDAEAADRIRQTLLAARSRSQSLPLAEDKAVSRSLARQLDKMVGSGSVKQTFTGSVGWTLAFTSMDPSAAPPGSLEHVANASSYGLAVTFRKSAKYPFGTYWALLFLGEAPRATASAGSADASGH